MEMAIVKEAKYFNSHYENITTFLHLAKIANSIYILAVEESSLPI